MLVNHCAAADGQSVALSHVCTAVVLAAGVNAVFGFPLQLGAIRLGTLGLYRVRPGADRHSRPARGARA
ncbi:MAG TPA: hypothetical protein VGG16_13920 [Streptosporangiaceae bacterium]